MRKFHKLGEIAICMLIICCLVVTNTFTTVLAASSDFQIENGILKGYHGAGGDVIIPDGVVEIDSRVFEFRMDITSIRFPEGLTTIGSNAFLCCYGAKILNLPSSVRHIGAGAFNSLSPDTPYSVRLSIWKLMLQLWLDPKQCVEGQSRAIIAASEQITSGLEHDYEKAKAISKWVSENIKYDYEQYYGTKPYEEYSSAVAEDVLETRLTTCEGYANLTVALLNAQGIPAIVEDGLAGEDGDWGGHAWNEAYVDGRWILIDTVYGPSFDMDLNSFAKDHVLWWRPITKTEEEPQSVEFQVEDGVLKKYNGTNKSVTIPSGIWRIDKDAFRECTNLNSVSIPNGVTEIGDNAFYRCENLARVSLPSSLEKIGSGAFGFCASLEQIAIPEKVTDIGPEVFFGCSHLKSIELPSELKNIDYQMFAGCEELREITLPSNLQFIGYNAFSECTSLEKITIPKGVSAIQSGTFEWCASLKEVSLPQSIGYIGSYAFGRCSSLTEIAIPASVTEIEYSAFSECDNLRRISFAGTKSTWEVITNGVESRAEVIFNAGTEAKRDITFDDVPRGAWFEAAVSWALDNGVTVGMGQNTFGPEYTCTTEQILTFLYRAEGEPITGGYCPYPNVGAESPYYGALCWSYETGILLHPEKQPSLPCSRSDVAMYLWKLSGRPRGISANPFVDVSAESEYAQAVAWAASKGVTEGTSKTTFSPEGICTRAQIVTFLYRFYQSR